MLKTEHMLKALRA